MPYKTPKLRFDTAFLEDIGEEVSSSGEQEAASPESVVPSPEQ
jgi:hypothetical protein